MLLGALAVFSNDLAIDLGTANTCVFARGRGIVLSEPSIVAFNTVNAQIEAVGNEAKEMLGRTPGNITAIKPMRDGVIADFEAAERMLGYFIRKAHKGKRFVRPRVIIGVPSEITQVERRAVKDSAYRAKASEVHLIEEGMAAAIGAGHADHRSVGQHDRRHRRRHDRHRGALARRHRLQQIGPRRGQRDGRGDHATWARKEHNLLIGERTAERIKMEIGSAAPLDQPKTIEVKGRHQLEGKPTTVTMTDDEIREALAEPIRHDHPGGARRSRADAAGTRGRHLRSRHRADAAAARCCRRWTSGCEWKPACPCQVAEDPLSSVVLGAGKMLSDFNLLRKDLDRIDAGLRYRVDIRYLRPDTYVAGGRLHDPLGRRLDRRLGRLARIRPAASRQPADRAHGHVVVADDLTRQAHAGQASLFQPRLLGLRHPLRLAADELDSAGRAARVAAAGVQDIDMGILLDRKHEALADSTSTGANPSTVSVGIEPLC